VLITLPEGNREMHETHSAEEAKHDWKQMALSSFSISLDLLARRCGCGGTERPILSRQRFPRHQVVVEQRPVVSLGSAAQTMAY